MIKIKCNMQQSLKSPTFLTRDKAGKKKDILPKCNFFLHMLGILFLLHPIVRTYGMKLYIRNGFAAREYPIIQYLHVYDIKLSSLIIPGNYLSYSKIQKF